MRGGGGRIAWNDWDPEDTELEDEWTQQAGMDAAGGVWGDMTMEAGPMYIQNSDLVPSYMPNRLYHTV